MTVYVAQQVMALNVLVLGVVLLLMELVVTQLELECSQEVHWQFVQFVLLSPQILSLKSLLSLLGQIQVVELFEMLF